MVGALYNGVCYVDAVTAASAQCAASSGITAGGVVQCTAVAGTLLQPSLSMRLVRPAQDDQTFSVTFAHRECDPFEPYADMLTLSAAAIPAILGVVLIREFVLRFVRPQ